jgi:hypothetical protein
LLSLRIVIRSGTSPPDFSAAGTHASVILRGSLPPPEQSRPQCSRWSGSSRTLGRPLFEHCNDGPRNLLAIFQGSHRNFADAAGMVDADLRHSAIQIAAREADFPDRIPFNAATVPKGNSHFVDAYRPVQASKPKHGRSKAERDREQDKHQGPIARSERYSHYYPLRLDDRPGVIWFLRLS